MGAGRQMVGVMRFLTDCLLVVAVLCMFALIAVEITTANVLGG